MIVGQELPMPRTMLTPQPIKGSSLPDSSVGLTPILHEVVDGRFDRNSGRPSQCPNLLNVGQLYRGVDGSKSGSIRDDPEARRDSPQQEVEEVLKIARLTPSYVVCFARCPTAACVQVS